MIRALETFRASSRAPQFEVLTFTSDGEVELLIGQFQAAQDNDWMEKQTLLRLKGCRERRAGSTNGQTQQKEF